MRITVLNPRLKVLEAILYDHQRLAEEWIAQKLDAKRVYEKIEALIKSQNCIDAAEEYFAFVSILCPHYSEIAHSLLRKAVRPLFYMDISETDRMLDTIKRITGIHEILPLLNFLNFRVYWLRRLFIRIRSSIFPNKQRKIFLQWLEENRETLACCMEELKICCIFYSLSYDEGRRIVILDYRREFENILDTDLYMEFGTFEAFKIYFSSFFETYEQAELERLLSEEGYVHLWKNPANRFE